VRSSSTRSQRIPPSRRSIPSRSTARRNFAKEYDVLLFDFARQDAATWSGLNLAPHLSAIIQFRGALSSREDENDDDDAGFFYSPFFSLAKIVIRAGATNAFGHIK